jgi:phosphatidylserine/phosphatidylglycerophosphate/cardiolipin synthase-like enzyme
MSVDIYLPCDVLMVNVRVAPQKELSTLESLFLRAVLAGKSDFAELRALFGIGERPTLDLVFDLWQKGYVALDMSRGGIYAASGISLEKLKELRSGEESDEQREVLQERVGGAILPPTARKRLPEVNKRALIPADQFRVGPKDVTEAGLLAALRWMAEKEAESRPGKDGGRPKQILGANLSFTDLGKTSYRRWLPLVTRCAVDPARDSLHIEIADDRALPAAVRLRIENRLRQFLAEQPQSDLAKYLRESAASGPPPQTSIEKLLPQLEKLCLNLENTDPGLYKQAQDRLDDLADQIEDLCASRIGSQIVSRVMVTKPQHDNAVHELIAKSQQQIVLASPWMTLDAVLRVRPWIKDALDRGVQVFLLWGFRPDEEMPPDVANALLPLRQEYRGRFFVAGKSTGIHAKLLVQDGHKMLVSTLNFLQPSEVGTFEVGVLIEAKEPQRACPPIEDALDWASDALPDYRDSQTIYSQHEDFCPHRNGDPDDALEVLLERPVRPVPPIEETIREAFLRCASRLWSMSWNDYCKSVRGFVAKHQHAARLLVDPDHSDLFSEALQFATRRLLIASDRLGVEVVTEEFLIKLRALLEQEVFVTLIYRRPTATDDIYRQRLESLRGLAADFPDRFRWFPEAKNHAKVLLFDETAVVSSFNFLSFGGDYGEATPSIRRRMRKEVGVQLTGGGIADRVIDSVEGAFPGACAGWPRSKPEGSASLPDIPIAPSEQLEVLERLFDCPDDTARGRVFAEIVRAVSDPWWLLQRLADGGLTKERLKMGVAAALSCQAQASRPPNSRRDDWRRWLIEELWGQGSVVEAAVLAADGWGRESPELPRPQMIMLAAAYATGLADQAIADLVLVTHLAPEEQIVVAVVALVEAALKASPVSLDVILGDRSHLPEPWRPVIEAFADYWSIAYQPLPVEQARLDLAVQEQQETVKCAWQAFSEALTVAASQHFHFESGTLTHFWLFPERKFATDRGLADNAFGKLRESCEGQRSDDVRGWLTWFHDSFNDDLEDLIDKASFEGDPMHRLLVGNRRASYLELLEEVVKAARHVAKIAKPVAAARDRHHLAAAKTFAQALAAIWPTLEHQLAAWQGPERRIVERALADLRFIADWGALR